MIVFARDSADLINAAAMVCAENLLIVIAKRLALGVPDFDSHPYHGRNSHRSPDFGGYGKVNPVT